MNGPCAFCGGNDWSEIASKKVHCLKCGANRFLSQALPKKSKKAKTEEKPSSVVSDSDIDSDSRETNDEPTRAVHARSRPLDVG